MATGMHPSTVGFSVRNYLSIKGAYTLAEIAAGLRRVWDERLEDGEVERALAELEKRAMVRRDGERFIATDGRFFTLRARANTAKSDDDPEPWEGWGLA